MKSHPKLVTVVALTVTVLCLSMTAVAVQGRSDAVARERAADEREQAALDRMPGRGPMSQRLTGPAASEREQALRASFDSDALGAITRLGSAVIATACVVASSGDPITDPSRTAQEIVDQEAATTDLPELVALPDDEWRALLGTELVEEELARCGA